MWEERCLAAPPFQIDTMMTYAVYIYNMSKECRQNRTVTMHSIILHVLDSMGCAMRGSRICRSVSKHGPAALPLTLERLCCTSYPLD